MEQAARKGMLATLVIAAVTAVSAGAQEPSGHDFTIGAPNFVIARYASVSASSLYAGYSLGAAGVLVAMVNNPRSGYHELVVGAMSRIARGQQGASFAVAIADASDATYLQVYLVPSVLVGRFSLSSTIEWYDPVARGGSRELDLNPVTARVQVNRWLGMGVAYALALPAGTGAHERIGPTVRVAIPRGALYTEFLRNLRNSAAEVRVGMDLAF